MTFPIISHETGKFFLTVNKKKHGTNMLNKTDLSPLCRAIIKLVTFGDEFE